MPTSRLVHAASRAALLVVFALWFSAGPRAQSSAAVLVVHPSVSTTTLTVAQVHDIFLGEQQHWPGSNQRITVVRADRGAAWELFRSKLLKLSEPAYARRVATRHYAGTLAALPRVVNSPADLRRLVAQTPGAIGVLLASDVDDSVKVLKLGTLSPADAEYILAP